MENVKKVKAGELAIRNNDKEAVIKCCKFIWPVCATPEVTGTFYYSQNPLIWVSDFKTTLPTILATELLKEIEAGEQPKPMTTLEKVRAYLEKLDEPYRTEALSQIDHKRLEEYMPEGINSRKDAINLFAIWVKTKEGRSHWFELWENLPPNPEPLGTNNKDPESRISELTAQKEAIEAEIEKLKAESKKFNAERALAGEPCETISGVKVLVIHRNPIDKVYPLYVLLNSGEVKTYTIDGFILTDKTESPRNLKMS